MNGSKQMQLRKDEDLCGRSLCAYPWCTVHPQVIGSLDTTIHDIHIGSAPERIRSNKRHWVIDGHWMSVACLPSGTHTGNPKHHWFSSWRLSWNDCRTVCSWNVNLPTGGARTESFTFGAANEHSWNPSIEKIF